MKLFYKILLSSCNQQEFKQGDVVAFLYKMDEQSFTVTIQSKRRCIMVTIKLHLILYYYFNSMVKFGGFLFLG